MTDIPKEIGVWHCSCGHALEGDPSTPPFNCTTPDCTCDQCARAEPWPHNPFEVLFGTTKRKLEMESLNVTLSKEPPPPREGEVVLPASIGERYYYRVYYNDEGCILAAEHIDEDPLTDPST